MTTTSDRISDARLAEMLADAKSEADRKPRDETVYDFSPEEAVAALTELQSLRAAPVEPGVKVKGLEWDRESYAGWTEAVTLIGEYRAYADGTLMLDRVQLSYVKGRSWHDTESAAQADYERRTLSALEPLGVSGEPVHQQRVAGWMQECFGPEITADKIERADRFIEEALELAQATGWTVDRGHALVDYVFGRPVGEIGQEVGGVMVTLAALCNVFLIDMNAEAKREVDRITQPEIVLKIRAKQAAKPTGSALPIASPPKAEITEEMVERAAQIISPHCMWDAGYVNDHIERRRDNARNKARASLTAALSTKEPGNE